MEDNKVDVKLEEKEITSNLIDYDTFSKVQLRVGTIISAEKIEKSEKLLKLQVNLGPELGQRQILAGIAKHYEIENLIGKNIVVVTNLKPAKLMGIESQGMLLAASNSENLLEVLSVNPEIQAGSIVR
jgi:methionyl-tRNA synthetase